VSVAGKAPEAEPIERIDPPSAAEFRSRWFEPGRPVVIQGAARDWPALEKWNLEALRAQATKEDVPVDVYPRGDFFEIGGALGHRRRVHLPFADYLDASRRGDGDRYYAPDLELCRYLPELERDVRVPGFLPPETRARLFLFAGHGAITAGHFHPFTHALTCQVTGTKRVVVYPPEDGPNLYGNPWFAPAFHWSRVNFTRPDLGRHPRFSRARPRTCVLEPGDALFIPVHFWHWTEGVDFSVSLLVSFRAKLSEWRFPRPGFSCLFAAAAWPVEERLRDVAMKALALTGVREERR
jgi:hypothetical protein